MNVFVQSQFTVHHSPFTAIPSENERIAKDNATQTLYYNNNIIDADRGNTYDALYRLTNSTGREHINQPGTEYNDFPSGIVLPHPNDPQAMRRYSRAYAYDNSGNISEMAHTATGANWTRDYTYNSANNKLTQTQIGSTPTSYTYDNHGNLQSLPNVTAFTWDFMDRIKEADLGGGGTAYYTYNAQGERIRKVIHNNSDIKIKETIYLDGYEVYHEFVTGTVDFERETLHVNDDESRVAMVETKTIENGTPITTPVPRIRYQHSDHLGSSSVETTDTGALISFEEYYPYGGTSFKSTSSSSQVSAKRYRYNGKEKDEETNLYYYGARYYISWLGRWMSCDPIGEEGSGLNLYRYASNNPVMRVDPTGLKDEVIEQNKKEYKIDDLQKWYSTNPKTGQNQYNQEITDIFNTFKELGTKVEIINDQGFKAAYDQSSNTLKIREQFLTDPMFAKSAPEELSVFVHEGTHLKQWFGVFKERLQKEDPEKFGKMSETDLKKSFGEMSNKDREGLFKWKATQAGSKDNFIEMMLGFEKEAYNAQRDAAKKLNEKSPQPLSESSFEDLYPKGEAALKRIKDGTNIKAEKYYGDVYGKLYDEYVKQKTRKR